MQQGFELYLIVKGKAVSVNQKNLTTSLLHMTPLSIAEITSAYEQSDRLSADTIKIFDYLTIQSLLEDLKDERDVSYYPTINFDHLISIPREYVLCFLKNPEMQQIEGIEISKIYADLLPYLKALSHQAKQIRSLTLIEQETYEKFGPDFLLKNKFKFDLNQVHLKKCKFQNKELETIVLANLNLKALFLHDCDLKHVEFNQNILSKLEEFNITDCWGDYIDGKGNFLTPTIYPLENCKKLKKLKLYGGSSEISIHNTDFKNLCSSHLEELKLDVYGNGDEDGDGETIKDPAVNLSDFPQLKHLTVNNGRDIHFDKKELLLESVFLRYCNFDLLTFLQITPQLEKLTLENCSAEPPMTADFYNLALKIKELCIKDDRGIRIHSIINGCPNLQSLSLAPRERFTASDDHDFADANLIYKQLFEQLNCITINYFHLPYLPNLLAVSPNLKELTFEGIFGCRRENLDSFFEKIKKLSNLPIKQFTSKPYLDEFILSVLSLSPDLEQLKLSIFDISQPKSKFNFRLFKLKKLAIKLDNYFHKPATEIGLLHLLSTCPNLEEFEVEYMKPFDLFAGLVSNKTTFPCLSKFKLHCFDKIPTHTHIETLAKVMPNITELDLSPIIVNRLNPQSMIAPLIHLKILSCENFPEHLIQAAPNLQILKVTNCLGFPHSIQLQLILPHLKKLTLSFEHYRPGDLEYLIININELPDSLEYLSLTVPDYGFAIHSQYEKMLIDKLLKLNLKQLELNIPISEESKQLLLQKYPHARINITSSTQKVNALTEAKTVAEKSEAKKSENYIKLDNNTEFNPTTTLNAKTFFLPKPDGYPHPSHYRLSVTNSNLIESKYRQEEKFEICDIPISKNVYNEYQTKYLHAPDHYLGIDDNVLLEPGFLYRLPSLNANEKLLQLECSAPIKVYYSKADSMYYIGLDQDIIEKTPTKILFILNSKRRTLSELIEKLPLKKSDTAPMDTSEDHPSFFKDIRITKDEKGTHTHNIPTFKDTNPKYHFLLKIGQFIEKNFKPGSDEKLEGLDLFIALVAGMKGACRHRSVIFETIAKALDIPCRIVLNPDYHAYVEIQSPLDDSWVSFELGGYPNKLDIAPIKYSPAPQKSADTKLEPTPIAFDQYLLNLEKGLTGLPRNVLFVFDTPEQIKQFNVALMRYLIANKKKHFYLHSFRDAQQDIGHVDIDGQFHNFPSDLLKFIVQGEKGDTFFVNWCELTTHPQYIGFNTLLDKNRNFEGIPIPKGTNLFGAILTSNLKKMREDFSSRHTHIVTHFKATTLLTDLYNGCVKEDKYEEKQDGVELYESENWQSILIGSLKPKGNKIEVHPGKLIEHFGLIAKPVERKPAGKEEKAEPPTKELVLFNPPASDEFQLFLSAISHKKCFSFNGEDYRLPTNFKIKLVNRPYTFDAKYRVILNVKPDALAFDYPLNATHFINFFTSYSHHKNEINALPSWLETNAGKTLRLLVTSEFKKADLARLLEQAKQHRVILEFVPAPGIQLLPTFLAKAEVIEESKEINKKCAPELIDSAKLSATHFKQAVTLFYTTRISATSNFLVGKMKVDLALSVHEDLGFNDVFCYETAIQSKQGFGYEFISQLGTAAELLLTGKTVLLKGKFSKDLAEGLQTLFTKEPFLFLNGKVRPITGKLIIITDDNQLFSFAPKRYHLQTLECKDEKAPSSPAPDLKPTNVRNETLNKLRHEPFVFLHKNKSHAVTTDESICRELGSFYKQNGLHTRFLFGLEYLTEWAEKPCPKNEASFLVINTKRKNQDYSLIFDGLLEKKPGLLVKGQFIALPPNKKIIFTGNNPGDFFKYKPRLIQLPTVSHNDVKQILTLLFAKLCPEIPTHDTEKMIQLFFNIANKLTALNVPVYVENAANFVRRFTVLKLKALNHSSTTPLLGKTAEMALYDEFHGTLTKQQRNACKTELFGSKENYQQLKTLLQAEIKQDREFYVTQSRHKLISQLDVLLELRKQRKTYPELEEYGTRGLLIEGPSGIGKSDLVEKYLNGKGLEPGKDFYCLTLTAIERLEEMIKKACDEGAILIIDEINSEYIIQDLILKHLSAARLAGKAGATIIGTLNPQSFGGRVPLDPEFKQNFQHLYLKNYKEHELIKILQHMGCSPLEAQQKAKAYLEQVASATDASKPTPRTFFRDIKHELSQRVLDMDESPDHKSSASISASSPISFFATTSQQEYKGEPSTKKNRIDEKPVPRP